MGRILSVVLAGLPERGRVAAIRQRGLVSFRFADFKVTAGPH